LNVGVQPPEPAGCLQEAGRPVVVPIPCLERWVRRENGAGQDRMLTREDTDGEHARPELVSATGRLGRCRSVGYGSHRSRHDAILLPVLGL
jgi:hypothetical protein